ncbi:MAG: DUF4173 domain-containing protein [Lachnospiraceae bacterium]|nr:DUF4173 domain-containing protein [Lachnospiraceae bacterium]
MDEYDVNNITGTRSEDIYTESAMTIPAVPQDAAAQADAGLSASEQSQAGPAAADAERQLELNRSWNFRLLALPCAIYALVFTFCMFKNWSGVLTPVWIGSLVFLVAYLTQKTGKQLKKGSVFMMTVMLIISVSCFCTANKLVLLSNYVAEFLLLMTLLLHNYADDSRWDLAQLFGEIVTVSVGSITKVLSPFTDGGSYFNLRDKEKKSKAGPILAGILIAIPTCIVLGLILASADAVFENIFARIFFEIIQWQNLLGILFMLAFGFISAYCGMRHVRDEAPLITVKEPKRAEPVAAITVTSVVALLYLVFSAVQILYLFIGGFELPEGISYAEYARRGFFQLLIVSVLNLAVVLILKKRIEKSRVLNAILLVICFCTYIMIASSAIRMIMYIQVYNLTMYRISVLFALLTLAVLLVGVIILVLKDDFSFRRFCVIAVSIVYIPFAFLNADARIARFNLANDNVIKGAVSTRSQYGYDYYYISSLSTDAAPAILEYFENSGIPESEMADTDWYIEYCRHNGIDGNFVGIRTFNVSEYRANRILAIPEEEDPFT